MCWCMKSILRLGLLMDLHWHPYTVPLIDGAIIGKTTWYYSRGMRDQC